MRREIANLITSLQEREDAHRVPLAPKFRQVATLSVLCRGNFSATHLLVIETIDAIAPSVIHRKWPKGAPGPLCQLWTKKE
jgi:hypothetical protein